MTSITLINPAHEVYAAHPSPPMWMATLQAILKEAGIKVRVIDEAAGQKIGNIDTEWVAFGVTTPTSKKIYALADKLRKDGKKVILGGPHPSIFPEEAKQHADKVIVGEADEVLVPALNPNTTEGILKGQISKPLDEFPNPCWDGFPLEQYHGPTRKGKYLTILTSRGCPHACVFCYHGTFGYNFNPRSPERVVNEIEDLIKKYSIKEISIIDDLFNYDRERAKRICELIIEHGIKISWSCPNGVRADYTDLELLQLMKKAGCYQLAFGVESGNQEIVNKVGKKLDLKHVKQAVENCRKVGIETIGFFIIGLPYDTKETMQQTIDFAKKLNTTYTQFTIATPYPGTTLFKMVQSGGEFLEKDWSKFGSYMGKATYQFGNLNPKDVEEMYAKAYKELYTPLYIVRKIWYNPKLIKAGIKYVFERAKRIVAPSFKAT